MKAKAALKSTNRRDRLMAGRSPAATVQPGRALTASVGETMERLMALA
jgi:hypothetical protein